MAVYEFELTPETTAKEIKARLAAFILLYGECGYIQLRGPVVTLYKGQMLPANYNSAAAVKKIGRTFLVVDEYGHEGDKGVQVYLPSACPVHEHAFGVHVHRPTLQFMTTH